MRIKKYKDPNTPIKYRTVKEANKALRDYVNKYKGYYFVDQDDNDPYRNGSVPNELYNSWKWNESIYHSNDPIELQYINRDMDYRKQQIDERFNKYFENGKIANLPTITKYGTPHLQVVTYPFAGESYPYSSHSEVYGPKFFISREMNDPNYNFLFNNCADSTYRFLDDVLGNEFDGSNSTWRPIMTPFIVEQLAKKVPGAKTIKEPDGLRDATITYIPLTGRRMDAYKNAVAKGAGYYESLKKQGGKLTPRKFQFGGIPTLTLPDQAVYVGPKGGTSRQDTIRRIYNEHLTALRNNINTKGWDNIRLSNMAKFMTAHKVAENGWEYGKGGPWAGFGRAKTAQEFVDGMFKNYNLSMNSTRYEDYVNNLNKGRVGKYNSVRPTYTQELLTSFGLNSRVWKLLNNI